MIRGLVIEGVSCSGKTSLLNALKRAQASEDEFERSVVVLGEHYSQVLQPVNGQPVRHTVERHREILDDRLRILEGLSGYAASLGKASQRARGLFYVFERFHLNHSVSYDNCGDAFVRDIEKRLLKLNAKCVLLTVSDTRIEERISHRNFHDWSQKSSEEQLAAIEEFQSVQNNFVKASKEAIVETVFINTDERDWDRYAQEILSKCSNSQPVVPYNSGQSLRD